MQLEMKNRRKIRAHKKSINSERVRKQKTWTHTKRDVTEEKPKKREDIF